MAPPVGGSNHTHGWCVMFMNIYDMIYQICTAPEPFDALVSGLGEGGAAGGGRQDLGAPHLFDS